MLNTMMMTIIAFLAFATFVFSSPPGTLATDMPHPVGVLKFTGNLGGHDVQLNGSVQQIYAQMQDQYPDFDLETHLAAANGSSSLEARGKYAGNILCIPVPGQSWSRAENFRIDQGINYLNALGGVCNIGATSCVRISCSWRSAIWLCNDNHYGIAPSCPYMASYARDLENDCSVHIPPGTNYVYCGGQEFDSDGYNIIVRYDDSDGC